MSQQIKSQFWSFKNFLLQQREWILGHTEPRLNHRSMQHLTQEVTKLQGFKTIF